MLTHEHLTPAYIAANTAERAVLVVDLCGFTKTVREEGLAGFLGRVVRLGEMARAIVPRWRGDLVKCEADNAYALFPSVDDALRAARALNQALPFPASAGIAHGPVLRIPSCPHCGKGDLWGDAVNTASKLGEDTAGPRETLVHPGAAARLLLSIAAGNAERVVNV